MIYVFNLRLKELFLQNGKTSVGNVHGRVLLEPSSSPGHWQRWSDGCLRSTCRARGKDELPGEWNQPDLLLVFSCKYWVNLKCNGL